MTVQIWGDCPSSGNVCHARQYDHYVRTSPNITRSHQISPIITNYHQPCTAMWSLWANITNSWGCSTWSTKTDMCGCFLIALLQRQQLLSAGIRKYHWGWSLGNAQPAQPQQTNMATFSEEKLFATLNMYLVRQHDILGSNTENIAVHHFFFLILGYCCWFLCLSNGESPWLISSR